VATLRTVLGVVLIGAGLGLATKAGLDVPATVLAGVPVLIALLVLGPPVFRRRARRREEAEAAAAQPEI
jgi:hypothetical protein